MPPSSSPAVVDALLELLELETVLGLRTQAAHWNVQGPGFFELHEAFGDQYDQISKDVDRIAERVRALGEPIAVDLSGGGIRIEPEHDGVELARGLLLAHEEVAGRARDAHVAASDAQDVGSAMLLEELALCHEKVAWMLRSYAGSEEVVALTPEGAEG